MNVAAARAIELVDALRTSASARTDVATREELRRAFDAMSVEIGPAIDPSTVVYGSAQYAQIARRERLDEIRARAEQLFTLHAAHATYGTRASQLLRLLHALRERLDEVPSS